MGMGQMITANRLADGVVVFFNNEAWVETLTSGALFGNADAVAAALTQAKADEARDIVVEPYAIDVIDRNGAPHAKHLREAIRAAGPTIRLDLGKQADLDVPAAA